MKERNNHASREDANFEQFGKTTDSDRILQSISKIYTSLYSIDTVTGQFTELSSLHSVHVNIGTSGNAQERLNYFSRHMVLPQYTEELLQFVDLSTVDERMAHTRIISKQYQTSLFVSGENGGTASWSQCSFIEGDRDADGRLTHIIFATQSIQETKVRELETRRKLQETNESLTLLLEAEKRHTAIIDSLSNVFFALYYIDVEQNVFQEIFSPDGKNHTYGEKENARARLATGVERRVNEDYRSAMSVFTDLDTVDERLGTHNIITQEYIDVSGNWVRCSLFPVEKNESGKNTKIIFGFRNITDEKERIESQDNLIRALSMSYENVYAVNMDTKEAVCYRMDKTIKSRYGQEFAVGDYELNIRLYVEKEVLPEDRHLFDRICSIEEIGILFAERQTYAFSYRVFRNGREQYFECQLVKPDGKRNEFAIGFKNIDNERQRELAQQKEVENALAAVEKVNEALRDETEIAGALSLDYPDVVLLDLKNETAMTIKRKGEIIAEENRVTRRPYTETWDYYISKYVLEEDREALGFAVRVENVKKALEKSDEYLCSYRVVADDTGVHYFQASFIRFYSQHKTESQIILGFRCVDSVVEEEYKNRAIQEEQLRIIGALSREYSSLFKIDAATRRMTLYRTDGNSFDPAILKKLLAFGDYEVILSKYIDTFVVPEDRDRLKKSVVLSVLTEKVPDKGLYKLGYRRIKDGVVSYFEMNTVKIVDGSGAVTFILGLRDVDEESRRQLKQTREMEM
ncbi:MAG: hypothetical protein ACI4S9_02685, partial [Christensenellales bacterium]